jgi:hypothetical protein
VQKFLSSKASVVIRDRGAADSRHPSPSGGVRLTLRPADEFFEKVKLTQAVRDGGVRLRDAVKVTEALVGGGEVTVELPKYSDRDAAIRKFAEIGVEAR